eukprot:gene24249-30568_t
MSEDHTMSIEEIIPSPESQPALKRKSDMNAPQFLSTAEAARMLGLSTTLVQTLVDQGDLKGWKTRGGHRRISIDSILDYQNASRSVLGNYAKATIRPRVTVVVETPALLSDLIKDYSLWDFAVDVTFFDSVTEALLELSSKRPDMMVVEMSMPRAQQEKTFQALENFNQRGRAPLSVVLISQEKGSLESLVVARIPHRSCRLMPELMLTSFSKNSPLSRTLARPGHNKNLLQANRDAVTLLGLGNDPTFDMKGQVLRQLRLTQNLDPAVLATEACISVAQLYEIEKGVDSLFYSDNLRQQAARRVAQLLGIDWDHIDESFEVLQTAHNVVTLQRSTLVRGVTPAVPPTALSATNAPNSSIPPAPSPIDIAVNSHNSLNEASTMPHGKTSPAAQTTFALGLSTPSADSQAVDEPEVKRIEQPSAHVRSGRGLWWLMTAIGLTAASFYVAEKEANRLTINLCKPSEAHAPDVAPLARHAVSVDSIYAHAPDSKLREWLGFQTTTIPSSRYRVQAQFSESFFPSTPSGSSGSPSAF